MRAWPAIPVFLTWTVVVWVGRIRNIAGDEDLSAGGRAWRLGAAVLFVVLALAVVVARRRAVSSANTALANTFLGALVVFTVGWWSVRGVGILLDVDHDIVFKVVHTVLMIGSIALAVWAWGRRDG